MQKILDILMERDGFRQEEAVMQLLDSQTLIMEAMRAGDRRGAEMILEEELGLGPEWLEALI